MKSFANTTEGNSVIHDSEPRQIRIPGLSLLEPEAYDFCSVLEVQVPELLGWVCEHKLKARSSSKQIFERTEFFTGIAEYYDSKVTPTWLVMACAIHIDL
jgi:hypothetical protein